MYNNITFSGFNVFNTQPGVFTLYESTLLFIPDLIKPSLALWSKSLVGNSNSSDIVLFNLVLSYFDTYLKFVSVAIFFGISCILSILIFWFW